MASSRREDISELINFIRLFSSTNFPLFKNYIREGNSIEQINEFQLKWAIKLPLDVVEYLTLMDGETTTDLENNLKIGIFIGLPMLSLDEIETELEVLNEINELLTELDESCSIVEQCISLTVDGRGNNIGIDLSEDSNGKVIIWGKDYISNKIDVCDSWLEFLKIVVDDLKSSNNFRIDRVNHVIQFVDDSQGTSSTDSNYIQYLSRGGR